MPYDRDNRRVAEAVLIIVLAAVAAAGVVLAFLLSAQ